MAPAGTGVAVHHHSEYLQVKPDALRLLSRRATPEIASIWAVVIKVGGVEGVVRRDTPSGTMAWQTDDPALAQLLLREARKASGSEDAYLVRFDRAVTSEGEGDDLRRAP